MSSMELHTGTLRYIATMNDLIDAESVVAMFDIPEDLYEIIEGKFNYLCISSGYIVLNDTLYSIESQEHDEYGVVTLKKNADGSIDFLAHFYNGGGCLSEVLEDKMRGEL